MVTERKDRILVLGFFGLRSNTKDGQDIKTRTLYDLLCLKMPGRVILFDTESLRFNRLNIFILLYRILISGTVVYLPAQHNLRRFFPILFELTRFLRIRLCYFVVGGWLPVFIKDKQRLIKRLKKIEKIFTETTMMKHILDANFGFQNVEVSPNFRIHDFKPQPSTGKGPLRIVFMSRIMKQKGIGMVFQYARIAGDRVVIDFYGPVSTVDQNFFFNEIKEHSNTHYMGFLKPEHVYTTLTTYDVLVLPTGFYTEGLPGAVIDAYISGIPVVVTNWLHASEFVQDRITGFIVPFENGYARFAEALDELNLNRDLLYKMKCNASEYSRNFSDKIAWETMRTVFENYGDKNNSSEPVLTEDKTVNLLS